MPKFQILLFIFIFLNSSGISQNNVDTNDQRIFNLPDDLSKIEDKELDPILKILGDASIIGVSEGTHGMIEPFYWRNALIKYLVQKERIGVIALESGLVESRLIYDYVNGDEIDIENALTNGIECGFSRFKQNRELLVWLRNYNSNLEDDQKIHIYGFDIPGCAPNPLLENAMSGFEYVLNYLKKVNAEKSEKYLTQLNPFNELLRIKDNGKDSLNHFTDIDSLQWIELYSIQEKIESELRTNSEEFILKSSQTDYDWAKMAINGAKQNIDFLYAITHSEIEHAPREKGMSENVKWIKEKEKDKSLLLFAHLAHLSKEIHMKEGKMAYPMCGEYLSAEYGDNYKVIGNFYSKLDWFDDDPILLEKGTIARKIENLGANNFYMELNKKDTTWNKPWAFGKPSSGGQVYMIPAKAIDIVFFNKVQTWIDAERYK